MQRFKRQRGPNFTNVTLLKRRYALAGQGIEHDLPDTSKHERHASNLSLDSLSFAFKCLCVSKVGNSGILRLLAMPIKAVYLANAKEKCL